MIDLLFKRRFSMGHRLIAGGSEKCALPHGHNEIVTVRLRPALPARLDGTANMVVSFERAKATWHRWIDEHVDHALQLAQTDPLLAWFLASEPARARRILVTPGDPTTEVVACCMKAKLDAFLVDDGDILVCTEIAIEETPTNTVVFDGDPAAFLPIHPGSTPWWHRPDMSINELAPTA